MSDKFLKWTLVFDCSTFGVDRFAGRETVGASTVSENLLRWVIFVVRGEHCSVESNAAVSISVSREWRRGVLVFSRGVSGATRPPKIDAVESIAVSDESRRRAPVIGRWVLGVGCFVARDVAVTTSVPETLRR